MAAWILFCVLLISVDSCLGLHKPKLKFRPYDTETQNQRQSCEIHAKELDALLESLIDAIKGDAQLSKHPHLYNIIEHYLHRDEPTLYANHPDQYPYHNFVNDNKYNPPYANRPLLKQKFVSDNFVEESGEDDFPPTNEVVQQVFKDIKILFRRKSKKRIPVGEIEDILLRNLRPFIIFPIVKPCRKENVDNMLNFVRSAYLRYIETPCYDNIARNEYKLQKTLRDYIWQKGDQKRILKPKSCKTRAFDYFLESIKIIVQLFIKNYDCHAQNDYNAPPVDEFDNVFSKNAYKTPRNHYRDPFMFPPFRSDRQNKKNQGIYLDTNDFDPNNIDDLKNRLSSVYNTETGKVTHLNSIRDKNVKMHLNDVGYGDSFYPYLSKLKNNRNKKVPSGKDSVLIGPVRDDEDKLRYKVDNIHLSDGGYGDMHYPYYATQLNQNGKHDRSNGKIPNLVDFYRFIYGSNGVGKLMENNNKNDNNLYLNFAKQQINKELNNNIDELSDKNTSFDTRILGGVKDSTLNILDPNDMLLDLQDFKNSNKQFAAFGSLNNRPSVELPSYDKSTNETANIELVYVVRHPRVVLYNPQFIVKQKMTYETYLKNLKEIFHAKHFGPDNEVQLLKVLKRAINGEIIPLYQSKEKYEPLLLKDVSLVNRLVKEVPLAKKPENPFPLVESQTEKQPSKEALILSEEEPALNNVTLREADVLEKNEQLNVVVDAKATSNKNHGLKSAYQVNPVFVDETRTSFDQAPLAQTKAGNEVHYYDTRSYKNIVETYKMNMDSKHALKL